MTVLAIALGLVLLFVGGDLLVRGAGRLALSLGISPLVVGLTVVAFATSAPELAASMVAARTGSPALALGNVLGSNIANIGLILGVAGLVRAIPVQISLLTREVPILVVSALLLVLILHDDRITRGEGVLLLVALGVYAVGMVRMELAATARQADAHYAGEVVRAFTGRTMAVDLGRIALSVGMLVGGADALVFGATEVAAGFGVPDRVVGLTVLAVGTSLPELASSVAAAWRGQGDLALGNVVGSNLFNTLGILGATAVARPMEEGALRFDTDAWVSVGLTLLLVPLLRNGQTLFRWEAALLLATYLTFLASLA